MATDSRTPYTITARHIRYVKCLTNNFTHNVLTREEKESAGYLGLVTAARTFKPGRGATFETYAHIRIVGAILTEEIRKKRSLPECYVGDLSNIADFCDKRPHARDETASYWTEGASALLSCLSVEDKRLVIGSVVLGKSLKELSALSKSVVSRRISSALRRCKEALEREENGH